jgi:hypothetical protein
MRSLCRVLPVSIVVLGAAMPSAAAAQAKPAATPNAPLTVSATCDAQGQTPLLRVQVANKSDRPTAVVLGFNADNGKTHVVSSTSVFAIRPATGAEEEYFYVSGKYAREYRAANPAWIVSLAPGATHDLELPLTEFISTLNYSMLDPAVVAGTRFVIMAPPAPKAATPVWTGKLEAMIGTCRY